MSQSFYTSLSGLNAFSTQISTISNNIANLETTGYKTSSVSFAEMINSVITGSSSASTGSGVVVDSSSVSWTQGDLSSTGNTYDLAITGAGFFLVTNDSGTTYYTRNGSFNLDEDGTVVDDSGDALQGYVLNEDGTLGTLGNISISSNAYMEPVATATIASTINLDSESAVGDTFSATITTYDSLGNEIPVEIEFTKTASNTWDWTAGIDSAYGTAAGSGTLTYDSNGQLIAGTDPTITLTMTNGASNSSITWDIYDDGGATNDTMTQYASDSLLSDSSQDGNSAGTLAGVSIDQSGVVSGTYSNNMVVDLYQIALASFTNTDGLKLTAGGVYEATATSGTAIVGVSGTGAYGTLTSGSLEISNVDLASQMSNMIIAQRAYQACSKVITVEDEMLQTILNI